jgi:hypothetical protein
VDIIEGVYPSRCGLPARHWVAHCCDAQGNRGVWGDLPRFPAGALASLRAAFTFLCDRRSSSSRRLPEVGLVSRADPVLPKLRGLAHRLMASGLSPRGYVAASTIMGLENVLDAAEDWKLPYPGRAAPNRGRDPLLYFVSVFGDPGAGSWGWRVSGHHLALNYTIVGGRHVTAGPMFLGARPALSPLIGSGVLRPLAGEEDLGRELLHSLAPPTGQGRALARAADRHRPVQSIGR